MGLQNITIAVTLFLGPAILIYLTSKSKILDKIGVVILCYVAGVLVGNTGFTGDETLIIQKNFSEISIAIALPLLLFTLDIPAAFRNAGRAILALVLASLSVMMIASLLFFFFRDSDAVKASHLASMAVGVYTGGTPNLAAVKTALQIPDATYIKFHTYDAVGGLLYLIFVFSVARPFFIKLFHFKKETTEGKTDSKGVLADQGDLKGVEDYGSLLQAKTWPRLLLALLVSLCIVGVSAFLGSFFSTDASSVVVILCITSLGIAASFVPFLRQTAKSFSLGMYLILIFCISVASLTDAMALADIDPMIAVFLMGSMFGGMLIHALLCKLAKIDVDTFLIVSVAAICSPPFVPPAAEALNKRSLIPIGLTIGILGYGFGNYLGISLHYFLSF